MEPREGSAASREGFTADKRALFSLLLAREGLSGPANAGVTRRRTTGPIPLSFPQQRLWLNERLTPSAAYNVAAVLRLDGVLRIDALERAVNELIHRHESLRTTFVVQNDIPVQVIGAPVPLRVPIVDLRLFALCDREAEAERLAAAEAREPFDLASGPLLRVSVLQLHETRHRLLITMHHIVSDGWSTAIFVRELTTLYALAVQGEPVRLDDPPLQYPDFALWQRQRLTADVLERSIAFWRQQLAGAPPLISLPTDWARPATRSSRGALHRFTWPRDLLDDIRRFSRHEDATVFMTLLTAFQVLLHRYSGETDLLIGTPVANRNRPELEGIIGFFVNTLVMRGDLSGDPPFRELVQRTRERCLSAYAHQDLPFERLVEALAPPRDRAYTPIFQVMFVLQNAPVATIVLPDLEVTLDDGDTASTAFDLTLSLQERDDGLAGSFEYATDLFAASSIDRMVGHLEALLRDALARPRQRISALQLLTPPERHRLLEEWNATRQVFPVNRPVHELFEDQVERTPHRVAVSFGQEQLTYRQLNSRANQLAHYLRGLGVGPETVVGICIERSLEVVVGLLGVLKAGGAYLPLEPSYPRERLAFMLEDANVPVLLCQDSLRGLPAANGVRAVFLDTGWEEIARASDANPESGAAAENLAYVIYTSGSTGRPKGVLISHRALSNHMLWLQAQFPLSEVDRVLQKTPFSFDASVWEFYAPLIAGARLVLARPGEHLDSASLVRTISDERITILQVVPTLLRMILDEAGVARLHCLRRVFCGGEPLPVELAERFLGLLDASLHNLYGPTEATIDATFWTCSPGEAERSVPIGRPVSNMRAYVLDRHLQPVPVGITGELYLAGDGLGRGYLNRSELTAENFVPDPFGEEPGGRLYRTGDLATFLSDGRIEFLGRLDAQVKLRGQRIELGEIEAVLREHHAVEDAVVVLQEEGANSRIVAYVVPARGTSLTPDALRSPLGETLPAYMVPSTFVFLDALPITAAGKVDRRALGAVVAVGISSQPYAVPRGPTEEVLANIWMDVLQRERVGAHDNFFELGGHSLLAMRVLSRVQAAFAIDLPMVRLFEHPTVAGLARCVEAETTNEPRDVETPIVAVQGREHAPLSVEQERIWWMEQLIPDTPLFNMPFAFRITGPLDVDSFYRSLDEIIRRHEALRTRFTIVDSGPVQTATSCKPLDRVIVDLSRFTGPEQEREVEEWARKNAYRPFDLTAGLLVRSTVLRLAETEHVAFVTVHHIAADAWSIDILIRELSMLYEAFRAHRSPSLPDVTLQYPDYAQWERAQLSGERFRAGLDYWTRRLGDAPMQTLPADRPRPSEPTFDTAVVPLALGAEAMRDLHQLSRSQGSSLFMLLLAAFKLSIYRWTGFSDLRVATLTANRQRHEAEGVIGCFANTIVLRTDLSGNPTFQELVKRVRQTVLDAEAYQEVPFELIVRRLETHREMKVSNLVNIEFDWQDAARALAIPDLEMRPLRNDNRMADLELTLTTSELVLSLSKRPEGISGSLTYKTALFDAETVERLGIDFHDVVKNVAQRSDRRLLELPPYSPSAPRPL